MTDTKHFTYLAKKSGPHLILILISRKIHDNTSTLTKETACIKVVTWTWGRSSTWNWKERNFFRLMLISYLSIYPFIF